MTLRPQYLADVTWPASRPVTTCPGPSCFGFFHFTLPRNTEPSPSKFSGNSQALKSCVCENGSRPTVRSSSCSLWLHNPHHFTHEGTNASARFQRGERGVRPCFPCSSPGSGPGRRAGGARLSCALTTARVHGAHAGLLQKTLQPLSRRAGPPSGNVACVTQTAQSGQHGGPRPAWCQNGCCGLQALRVRPSHWAGEEH